MSFLALARTWRPRRFDELVGQAHVVRGLTHALEQDKLHHALLFSGTRGVGKTTLARIIAKCLNCENGVSAYPCRGEHACSACSEIDAGRFVDLIEVDAASRTGVDDTRELMDNVQYAPTRGRTKVYLVDEVHMLSKHSFNALLKTLEEPPPRVQFLLATTEPEKIPVTVLSRCLQFPLKRVPAAQIGQQLEHIVAAEGLSAEHEALQEIARAAHGSVRDGLSLLDQAIAFGGGRLVADQVREMLGTIGDTGVAELARCIVAAQADQALEALLSLYAQGIDMRYLLEALATAWQHIATVQVVGKAVDEGQQAWRDLAERADPASVQVFYDITLSGIRDLAYAPDALVGVKMTLLRMLAFAPGRDDGAPGNTRAARSGAAQARARLQASTQPGEKPGSPPALSVTASASGAPQNQDVPTAPKESAPRTRTNAADDETRPDSPKCAGVDTVGPPERDDAAAAGQPAGPEQAHVSAAPADDWHRVVATLELTGLASQLADNGVCRYMDAERVVLEVARSNALVATPQARATLQKALAERWGGDKAPSLEVEFVDRAADTPAMRSRQGARQRQEKAVAAIENDPLVQQLRERLGAQVRPDTIKPNRQNGANPQRETP